MSAVTVLRRDGGDEGLSLHEVRAGELVAVFAPGLGGRLLSLRLGEAELLWQNPRLFRADLSLAVALSAWPEQDGSIASWANPGGGKTWPAPQGWAGAGQWAGPPDPVLDSGRYRFEASPGDGATTVRMVSAPDPRSGLRVTRLFRFTDDAAISQRIVFENVTDHVVRWAPWEVVQVPTLAELGVDGCGVVMDVADGTEPIDLGSYAGGLSHRTQRGRCVVPVQETVAKRGFPGASGAIGYRYASGRTLTLRFLPEPGATYPDGGSPAELWMQAPTPAPLEGLDGLWPEDWLCELEVLAPLRDIVPGDTAQLRIDWLVG